MEARNFGKLPLQTLFSLVTVCSKIYDKIKITAKPHKK